jgi:hypothetical protein
MNEREIPLEASFYETQKINNMNAKTELEKLKEEFFTLHTEAEIASFKEKVMASFDKKTTEEKDAFCNAYMEGAQDAVQRADAVCNFVNVKLKLKDVLDIIPISYISEKYFNKSHSWLSQRLNSNLVNGMPLSLSVEEIKILSNALNDISDKIKHTARSIA